MFTFLISNYHFILTFLVAELLECLEDQKSDKPNKFAKQSHFRKNEVKCSNCNREVGPFKEFLLTGLIICAECFETYIVTRPRKLRDNFEKLE